MNDETALRYFYALLDQGLSDSRAAQHAAQRFGLTPGEVLDLAELDGNMAYFEVDTSVAPAKMDYENLYPDYTI